MGGSKPTPPTIIMPEESNPQAFQTIIPQKSYKDLAESMNRTEREYNRLVDQRYDTVGTAAEMGKRNRGIEMQERASYLSSLPKGGSPDESFKETPREFPIYSNRRSTFDTTPGFVSGGGGRGGKPIPPGVIFSGGQSPRGTQPFHRGTGQKPVGQVGPPPGGRGFIIPRPFKPSDPAKEAASMRYNESKKAYAAAVDKAKKTPRSFMPITKDPGFAQNPDDLYLPKVINAPDEDKK